MKQGTLGMIGYGNMGTAIVRGLVAAGAYKSSDIFIFDTLAEKCRQAESEGLSVLDSIEEIATNADTVIVAVKPVVIRDVLGELVKAGSQNLVISIAAGISLSTIESILPDNPVIRVMPNTPCMIGEGASALARGTKADDSHTRTALDIMGTLGYVTEVPERLMDAVTGLSGSGPAFVAVMIDALTDGGVRAGIPRADALKLAAQTVLGTAKMILEKDMAPSTLRDMVTSPGGTTIEGIAVLESLGLRSAIIEAVNAAAWKSKELGS